MYVNITNYNAENTSIANTCAYYKLQCREYEYRQSQITNSIENIYTNITAKISEVNAKKSDYPNAWLPRVTE